jgi:chromosome partitioning protein
LGASVQTIVVFNQKGGVGKTITALNLSAAACRKEKRPLLVDLDCQCHLSKIYQPIVEDVGDTLYAFYSKKVPLRELMIHWHNIGQFIPAHQELVKVESKYGNGPEILFKLKRGLEHLNEDQSQDLIILDCPANTSVLSLNAIFAADLVVIPIASDHFSLQAAERVEHILGALEVVLKKRVARCYLITRYDKRRKISYEIFEKAKIFFKEELLDTIIYENVALTLSAKNNQDIFSYEPTSVGAQNYATLMDEIIQKKLIEIT